MKNNKEDLLYMTGLSIDKKRLNQIISNIHNDKDYAYWYNETFTFIKKAFNERNEWLKEFNESKLKPDAIASLLKILEVHLPALVSKLIFKKVFDQIGLKHLNKAEQINEYLTSLFRESQRTLSNRYKPEDFFSIYLSHQSDSLGVGPLNSLGKKKGFDCTHVYSDRDYYDNKYIDSVILKLNKKYLKDPNISNKKLIEELNEIFIAHSFDLIFSRILSDVKYKIKDKKIGFYDLVGSEMDSIKDVRKSLSERNLFGISLLSQILYQLNEKVEGKLELNSDSNNNEYLKELWNSASEINDDNNEKSIKLDGYIYFSNGLNLIDEKNNFLYTYNDDFFKTIYNENNHYKNDKEKVEKRLSEYVKIGHSQGHINNYVTIKDNGDIYIKVPIKMILSLPMDENNKPSSEISIPYGVDNNNDINIITVGGAEHNRALAHLINKHKIEYKSNRIFGFMDNYFDFEHKLKFKKNKEYNNAFLMGLNQPVSGYNAIFRGREDSSNGQSSAVDSKLLGFRLKEGNRTINILVIYGFSAQSSKNTIFNFVSTLSVKDNKKIFDSNYIKEIFEPSRNEDLINKGLSIRITFKENYIDKINKLFKNKSPIIIFNENKKLFNDVFRPWGINKEDSIIDETKIISTIQKGKITDE